MKPHIIEVLKNKFVRLWREPRESSDPTQPSISERQFPSGTRDRQRGNLDNRDWVRLMEDTATLLCEVDDLLPRVSEEQKPFACHIKDRLYEILESNGAQRIENDNKYDVSRHKVTPPARIAIGTPITEFIEPGLAIENKIIRRALVRIA